MKKAIFLCLLFISFSASSQNIVREELTAEDILYLATDISMFPKPKPEVFKNSIIHNLTNYEFEIQYDNETIYRGAIRKPSFSGTLYGMGRNKAAFCLEYNFFDIEAKLELTESKKLKLSETDTGEKYLCTDNYVLFEKNPYSDKVVVNDKLTEKMRIKFFKTTY